MCAFIELKDDGDLLSLHDDDGGRHDDEPFLLPFIVGVAALLIVAAVTDVHSLMSGTAAADFGGRRATATQL